MNHKLGTVAQMKQTLERLARLAAVSSSGGKNCGCWRLPTLLEGRRKRRQMGRAPFAEQFCYRACDAESLSAEAIPNAAPCFAALYFR